MKLKLNTDVINKFLIENNYTIVKASKECGVAPLTFIRIIEGRNSFPRSFNRFLKFMNNHGFKYYDIIEKNIENDEIKKK